MISVRADSIYYKKGEPVLSDVSLNVNKGEIVTILGRSGCGKSTLLKILAGLHSGYNGTVEISGIPLVGYIPQNKCLLPWKTVYENLILLKKIVSSGKASPSQIDAAAAQMLERLSMSRYRDQFVQRLSGGEYQRVVLGQVFLLGPDLILMDEPFSALDNDTKKEIITLFLELQQEKSITTVFVTHNLDEAKAMNGRIIEL